MSKSFCHFLLFLIFISGFYSYADQGFEEWVKDQPTESLKRVLLNISPGEGKPGAVIASPSKQNPNYFFHWVRDAGLVTDSLLQVATFRNIEQYYSLYFDFIDFTRRLQTTSTPSGNLGEPRFNVDGTVAWDNWPRPQNDGPALRALSFIRLAKQWLAAGKEEWVRQYLYNGNGICVIKPDLEFVSHSWKKTSFDLWEEISGHHFFTELVQYRALKEGGALALAMGDSGAGGWYLHQATEMEALLNRHWSASHGYLLSTIDQDKGIQYKNLNLDSSILIAAITSPKTPGIFSVTDDRLIATVHRLVEAFRQLYPINQGGGEGIAMGRYPEDRYDGAHPNAEGNPWYITTAAAAEFHYLLAHSWRQRGRIDVSPNNYAFLNSLGIEGLSVGSHYNSRGIEFNAIIEKLKLRGDAFLNVIKRYQGSDHRFTEQFNRRTGAPQGAVDLTWSYASVLTAIKARLKD